MWVAAVKSEFYIIRKWGALRSKNRQNPFFPVRPHALRQTARCRNLKFGMLVPFVRGLLPLLVFLVIRKVGALRHKKPSKIRFFLFFKNPFFQFRPHAVWQTALTNCLHG